MTLLPTITLAIQPVMAVAPAAASPQAVLSGTTGEGGRKVMRGVAFESFDAVVRFGVAKYPSSKSPHPVDVETEASERAKKRSNSGLADPTTKQIIDAVGGSAVAPAAILGNSFEGITGGNPPDGAVAAGPFQVISASNQGVRIHSKDGTSVGGSPTLRQFFASVVIGPSTAGLGGGFDPRAVFDPYISRFWVIAVGEVDPVGTTAGLSSVFVALSNTNDAIGGWTFFRLNMRLENTNNVEKWCDYPSWGVSSDAIFVSCNMYNFPAVRGTAPAGTYYSKVRTMTKAQFLTNACCTWWDNWDLREGGLGLVPAMTVQAATMYGAAGVGEFLVNSHAQGGSGHVLQVWKITNAANCCVAGAQASPTWQSYEINVGSYPAPPSGAQPGTNGIATGSSRLQSASWRAGQLSTTQTTACADGSGGLDACVAFTEINVSAYPVAMSLTNDWAWHPANGTDRYFPAVVSNNAGDKTMVFTKSNGTLNPTATFLGIPRSSTCTTCVDGAETTLLAGTAAATCTVVSPATSCNASLGDYQAASPDPDGTGIWISGQAFTSNLITQVGLTQEAGDTTPPVTTATQTPIPDDGEIHHSKPVTVTLTSTDAGSGPWKISYRAFQGAVTLIPQTTVTATTVSIQVTTDDTHIVFRGIDRWGNLEANREIVVWIDQRPQKIVFASTRDGNSRGNHELYVMNADGSGQVRLTYNDADDTQPVLDHLGRVFFTSNRDGNYEIYRLDRDSSVHRLTNSPGRDVNPAVESDGNLLAFASNRSGNLDIYSMNTDGGNVSVPLYATPNAELEPDWLTSSRLAWVHNDSADPDFDPDDYNIYVGNPNEFLGTPGQDRSPAWNHDGSKIAASLDGDIVVFDVHTASNFTYLTQGPENDASPTWSPGGGFIAFSTDRTGDDEIFRMASDGSADTNLTNDAGNDVEPYWEV
ncbi:MAG: hypothetical protein ABIZ34_01935, partial [Candidatus Limnocylindrales bacterium]